MTDEVKNWYPLESNPTVINTYISNLGLSLLNYSFQDVYSVDSWALDMINRPILGVLMVYPIKDITEEYNQLEYNNININGQIISNNIYFMKQIVGNACGTIALLHCIGNVRDQIVIENGSYLDRFYSKTNNITPDEIAQILNTDEEIEQTHEAATLEGSSDRVEDVDTHFICFSCVDGHIYELDGRKSFPINHGPCTPETLLERSVDVIKQFMARDPEEMRFTIIALAKNPEEEGEENANEES